MAKNCIICGQAAGSAEHVFPSALGGRRKNKKIYCDSHNNAFGPYVSVLEGELRLFNASLDLTTDRRSTPKPVELIAAGGRDSVLYTGSKIEHNADLDAILNEMQEGIPSNVKVGSLEQIERLKREAAKKGLQLTVIKKEFGQQVTHGLFRTRLSFGGAGSLRSIAYLALTFFAHHFPEAARDPALDGVKSMLRYTGLYAGKGDVVTSLEHSDPRPFVKWARPEATIFERNPFEFGHAVAVWTEGGRAYAYVSFFRTFNYLVNLGQGVEVTDSSMLTFIDPLALKQPGEWIDFKGLSFSVNFEQDDYFSSSEFGDEMARSVGSLYERISRRQEELSDSRLLDALLAHGKVCSKEDCVRLLADRRQMIFNALQQMAAIKLGLGDLDALFAACVQMDESRPSGLSREGEIVLQRAMDEVADLLFAWASSGAVDVFVIDQLFRGETCRALLLGQVVKLALENPGKSG